MLVDDPDEAMRGMSLANADSLFMMGLFYDLGRGVKRDKSMALKMFQEAAELGSVDAMVIVSHLLAELCSKHHVLLIFSAGAAPRHLRGLYFGMC